MTPLVRRVLARALAAAAPKPIKPEKAQAMMLKLRKGAGWGQMKELMPLFVHLGWRFDEVFVLRSTKGYDTHKPAYFSGPIKHIQEDWDRAKKDEVSRLPDPDSLPISSKVYRDVSELKLDEDRGSFTAFEWQVTRGVKVTSPRGKVFTSGEHPEVFAKSYPAHMRDFSTGVEGPINMEAWLKGEGGFVDQINEVLGTPSIQLEKEQKERERREKALATENAGTCGACFGIYKLSPKTREGKDKSMPGMVLHGYERPGIGYIDGNCLGVGYPPYELSTEATVVMRARVKGSLDQVQDQLARWKDRIKGGPQSIDELHESSSIDFVNRKIIEKKLYRKDFTERDWARKIESKTTDIERTIDRMDTDLKRLDRMIREWKQAPLRSKA